MDEQKQESRNGAERRTTNISTAPGRKMEQRIVRKMTEKSSSSSHWDLLPMAKMSRSSPLLVSTVGGSVGGGIAKLLRWARVPSRAARMRSLLATKPLKAAARWV